MSTLISEKKQTIKLLIHASVWLSLLVLPILLHYYHPVFRDKSDSVFFLIPMAGVLLLMVVFYTNYHLLLPKIWLRHGGLAYLLISVLLLAAIIFIHTKGRAIFFQDNFPLPEGVLPIQVRRGGLLILILLNLLTWVVSSGLWLLQQWKKSEEQLQESEYKRTKVELDYLKKQIHPHFLFNTLNSIYALTLLDNKLASTAILKLSNLMNFLLIDASHDLIDLDKELSYLEAYIDLNRLRLTENSPLHLKTIEAPASHQIAPLLMLSFIENAFKYGISNIHHSPIWIEFDLQEDTLFFYCKNKLFNKEIAQQHGIGIENTRRRLQLAYPNAHHLTIKNDGIFFTVQLQIDLQKVAIAKSDKEMTYELFDVR
ncbi:MAG: histidine kinase [Bacteroidota bacterium]